MHAARGEADLHNLLQIFLAHAWKHRVRAWKGNDKKKKDNDNDNDNDDDTYKDPSRACLEASNLSLER